MKSESNDILIISSEYIIIIGDIGGTNVRLSLQEISSDSTIEPKVIDKTNLKPHDFNSLESLFKEYISHFPKYHPSIAVIGLPGPVNNNQIITFPNIPYWKGVNGEELSKKLGLKKFLILNDFVCNGFGIQTKLKENIDIIKLNDSNTDKDGQKVIIGPGTGLGISCLIKFSGEKYYKICPTEGGRKDFVAKNKKYREIVELIKKETGIKNVSICRLCSGRAFIPLYKYIIKSEKITEKNELTQKIENFHDYNDKINQNLINIEITSKAINNECEICKKVLLLFIEIFGEIAGDIALFTFPSGGVYLVGGISVGIEKMIMENKELFIKHFFNKDGFEYLLKMFPIYLIRNPDLGLIGAREAARRLIEKEYNNN